MRGLVSATYAPTLSASDRRRVNSTDLSAISRTSTQENAIMTIASMQVEVASQTAKTRMIFTWYQ
jgi:hypothetical protein